MGLTGERGRAGERLAEAYLELLGARPCGRNVRIAGVEVDLVVDDGPVRVLVEVKLRSRGDYGGAALAVDHRKRHRLLRAASALVQTGISRVRVDVVTIDLDPDGARVSRYRNIVES
jgi:putative endonuclease